MKAVAQYNRKEIIGNIPSVQPSMAQPRFFSEFSEQIQRFEHKFTESCKVISNFLPRYIYLNLSISI